MFIFLFGFKSRKFHIFLRLFSKKILFSYGNLNIICYINFNKHDFIFFTVLQLYELLSNTVFIVTSQIFNLLEFIESNNFK